MKVRRGGWQSYLFWVSAGIAIWAHVLLRDFRPIYPELPDTGHLLHYVCIGLFFLGWGLRKEIEVPREPKGDLRFLAIKIYQNIIVALFAISIGVVVGFGPRLFKNTFEIIQWDFIAIAAMPVAMILVWPARWLYNRLLEKYGTKP